MGAIVPQQINPADANSGAADFNRSAAEQKLRRGRVPGFRPPGRLGRSIANRARPLAGVPDAAVDYFLTASRLAPAEGARPPGRCCVIARIRRGGRGVNFMATWPCPNCGCLGVINLDGPYGPYYRAGGRGIMCVACKTNYYFDRVMK